MHTWVYKSARKADTFLYIDQEGDFTRVPSSLLDLLGQLDYVLSVDLATRKSLARADIDEVRSALECQGFFLQLPPADSSRT